MRVYLAAIFASSIFVGAAESNSVSVRIGDYLKNNNNLSMRELNVLYLDGVREGITTALALLPDGTEPICMPPKLALTVEQAEEIMLRFAKDHSPKADTPIGVILYLGLKDAFPCAKR